MSPAPTSPPMAERGSSPRQFGDIVQAGRSTASLNAEKNAANIRATGDLTPVSPVSPVSSQPSLISEPELIGASIPTTQNQTALFTPTSPSPLATSSRSSTDDLASTGLLSQPSDASSEQISSGPTAALAASLDATRRPSIPNRHNGGGKNPFRNTQSSSRPDAPRSIAEPGFGYSRYPASNRSNTAVQNGAAAAVGATLEASSSSTSLNPMNPFSDANANTSSGEFSEKWLYVDEKMVAFDPYFNADKDFIRYRDEIEDDDEFHQPTAEDDPNGRPVFRDVWHPRVILSTIAFICLSLGIILLFVLVPALTFATRVLNSSAGSGYQEIDYGPPWAHVNNNTYPLLQNVRRGLIDPDTPQSAMTRTSTFDGATLNLVFSDEFNQNNRTFYPGDDPYWTAPDIWYGATQDLEWYDPAAATTWDGTLQLQLDQYANHGLQFRSGMLNSWNQLCFKGGVMEVSISLPGPAGVPGLWPGAWSMGNLGRPGYKATTEGVWPYTYDECDVGITPNQSDPSGLSELPGQKLPACVCDGEDHPSPGTGRGAPEIDVIEASVDPNNRLGVVTQSFQVAPFDNFWRPNSDFLAIPNYNTTQMNGYTGGPFQQAVSGTTVLNYSWYDGIEYQKYAFEYEPGKSDGKIAWFVGEDPSFIMDGRAIGQNGNAGPRQVSEEPMSMVLNLGISTAWGEILYDSLKFPTIMRVDYVRIYQREGQESITCDPPGYPTTQYIADHMVAYTNPNLTAWNQTGYDWPRNSLVKGSCS